MEDIITGILDFFQNIGKSALSVLPASPFLHFLQVMESQTWLRWLNWLIPISSFIAIMQAWLVCVASFYVYQLVLRWVKAIS